MNDVEWLVTAFKDLREGDGLTPDKVTDYKDGRLLQLLGTPGDGAAVLQVIDQLIEKMLDRSSAWDTPDGRTRMQRKKRLISRAVRVALAIGEDDEGKPLKSYGILKERRDWACGVDAPDPKATFFFMYCDPATHRRYENDGFLVLARLVVASAENPSFNEAADHELAEANQVAPFTSIDPTDVEGGLSDAVQVVREQADHTTIAGNADQLDQDDAEGSVEPANPATAGLRGKVRAIHHDLFAVFGRRNPGPLARPIRGREIIALVGGLGAVGVVITLMATGVIPSSLRDSSSTSATPPTRPSAAISNAPAEKIDNTGGWGPSRKTFTGAAPYAVLNSLTAMPGFGDERNFFSCHDLANHDPSGWGNNLLAEDQHTYQCELFADNDVSPMLDPSPSAGSRENIAVMLQNTRARVLLPTPELNPAFYGIVSADNSNPSEVWDAVNFISPKKVTLTYQAGSARLFTTSTDSVPLKDDASLTNDGALLGDKQDGYLGQKAEYILFNVTVTLG